MQYLGPKRLLLVLDNCEHLLDPTANAVDRIGQRYPGVAVLATSREGLAVAGERLGCGWLRSDSPRECAAQGAVGGG